MSYHCGIGPGLPGLEPRQPHVTCDGCGRIVECMRRNGMPTRWFWDNKAAPGWKLVRGKDSRKDYCERCKGQIKD